MVTEQNIRDLTAEVERISREILDAADPAERRRLAGELEVKGRELQLAEVAAGRGEIV